MVHISVKPQNKILRHDYDTWSIMDRFKSETTLSKPSLRFTGLGQNASSGNAITSGAHDGRQYNSYA